MDARWSARALADLEAIRDSLLERSLSAALRVVSVLRDAGDERLSTRAQRGRPGRWPGTRELVIPNMPCLLPYRVRGEVVEIPRVFHDARQWPPTVDS